MWIYVVCGECGANLERLAPRAELVPVIKIEMEDGAIAAEIVPARCARCRSLSDEKESSTDAAA
jgi:hypothetical protein